MLETIKSLAQMGAAFATILGIYAIWLQMKARTDSHLDRTRAVTQSTFAVLHSSFISDEATALRREFLEIVNGATPLREFAGKSGKQTETIRRILNQYELIAQFGQAGTIDLKAFERFWGGTLIRDADRCKEFIALEREAMRRPGLWVDVISLRDRIMPPHSFGAV